MQIKDKVALVLGASRGIGRAIAASLAERGAKLVLPYHSDWPEDAAEMLKEFARLGENLLACPADLRDGNQVRDLMGQIRERFGALHILVNNIERGGMPVVHGAYDLEVNKGQWELEFDTTLVGRSGPAGLLFNDGYAAANRAVSSFTRTWAREAGPDIRVNELMLGFFKTRHGEGTRGWETLGGADRQAVVAHTLLKRTGKLSDVVKAVLFLINDASYMTGAVLRLDGGYVLGGEEVPEMPNGILG